jgi:hypothetical protein
METAHWRRGTMKSVVRCITDLSLHVSWLMSKA